MTASTALTLPRACGSVPVKSKVISSSVSVTVDGDPGRALLVRCRAGGVDDVLELPATVREGGQHRSHATLPVGDHLVDGRAGEGGQPPRADHVRTELCLEVAGALLGRPRCGQQTVTQLGAVAGGWDAEALLLDVRRVRGHRAGRVATDVGVVRAVGRPADQSVVGERRRDDGDVVEVGAAREGVVHHHVVARSELAGEGIEGGSHGRGHRAEVHRDVLGLREQLAGRP